MWGGEGGKEERNKQNPAKTRQSWCFKMCTGTPHCGSGVQAGDELLIPTSSIRALPLLPLPPAAPHPPHPPTPSSAVCRSLRLRRDAWRKRQRHQPALCFFRWSENSQRQRGAALAVNQDRQCQKQTGGA